MAVDQRLKLHFVQSLKVVLMVKYTDHFRHLKLETCYVEERTLKMEEILPNVMDRYSTIGRAYDKLSQTLRMVQDLPLLIANIHPVSAYLRRTAVSLIYFFTNEIFLISLKFICIMRIMRTNLR